MNINNQPLNESIKNLFKRTVEISIFRPLLSPTRPNPEDVSKKLENGQILIGNIKNWAKGKYHLTDTDVDYTSPFKAKICKKNNKYVFELIESSEECLISRKGLLDRLIPIKKGESINLRSSTTIFFGDPQSNKHIELIFSNPLTITETILIGIVSVMSFITLLILTLCLLVLYEIPRVPEFALPQSIEIQSSDNERLLVTTADVTTADGVITTSYRLFVPIEKTGKYLYKAVIASEDRFFENNNVGVDGISILRAAFINLSKLDIVEGASTIHQQVISSSGIVPKTYIDKKSLNPYRKIREIAAAIKLAQTVSTDKVMEIYINSVHLGNGKDGFQSASYYYFDQPVENLNLSKITALVAAIPSPCIYNVSAKGCKILTTNKEVADEMNDGKNIVINTMLDSKFISQKEAEEAKQEEIAEADLHLSMSQSRLYTQLSKSGYFQTQINNLIKQSRKSHLIVLITLDTKKQAASDKVLQDTIATKGNEYNFKQGAIITLNSSNGEVVAITDDYRSTIAERASGSTFKLFDYLAALENNISPDKYFDCSATRGVSGCRSGAKKMNMFDGFARSENVIAIRVAESAGLGNVVKLAKNLGVSTTPEGDAVNLFLGGQNTKVIDMAKAYAAVVNRGAYYDIPKTIVSAQECNNPQDKKSCQPIQLTNLFPSPPRQVVKPENADLMVAMMRGVVETGGTGTLADIPYKYVVGKTGTTDNARDLWFIGALPQENLLVAVWIGNDQGNTDISNSGGEIAAQVWKDYVLMIEKS